MISIILILLAAFFNAVMDAVENENFFETIFRNLPKQFWYKRESWKYVKKIFGYRPDAWHLAKSCMLVCFAGAVVWFDIQITKWWHGVVCIGVIGVVWNLSFNLFYHVIFKVK